ncbi:hypothetical protein MMC31_007622 [Peltigera leucophlebia]|nr:hypothetical protein [Peltigera leucophlebia]
MSRTRRKGRVIVFDPETQTMTTEKLKHLGEPVIEQPTPKWQNHVLIYSQARSTEPEPERRLVAGLNLGKLGWTTNVKRLFGRRSHIYVMEHPQQQGGSSIS